MYIYFITIIRFIYFICGHYLICGQLFDLLTILYIANLFTLSNNDSWGGVVILDATRYCSSFIFSFVLFLQSNQIKL